MGLFRDTYKFKEGDTVMLVDEPELGWFYIESRYRKRFSIYPFTTFTLNKYVLSGSIQTVVDESRITHYDKAVYKLAIRVKDLESKNGKKKK